MNPFQIFQVRGDVRVCDLVGPPTVNAGSWKRSNSPKVDRIALRDMKEVTILTMYGETIQIGNASASWDNFLAEISFGSVFVYDEKLQ